MPAFRAERVELREDHTDQDARAVAGSWGWTDPNDNSGNSAEHGWAKVRLDSGARIDARKADLRPLPWPELGWPLTG
ncbi:MAG: hypothetical protein KGL39_35475 [Patescibacteria group bacterium]|nr:hypothetical protein [Patescibacteria group bacterium]